MAEEEKFEGNSIEEEEVEDEPENVEPINDEEESAPIEYTKKLGVEEEEEKEENPFTTFIDNCVNYLEGRSRRVVLWTLGIFLASTFNFIVWNFVESEILKYMGVLLSTMLLFSAICGILISYNVYNTKNEENVDVRLSGIILSVGSVLVTLFFMIYQIQNNDCLTEFSEANCDADISLRAVITISVYAGSIGIVMLIYGLGLLEKNLVPYALAIAFGGSLILTIVLLMSVYSWIEESVWLLLIPLLFLGMGLAGLHHRRYQLAGFVIGCYITGLAGIGWLIEPNLASGGFLGGGLPMTGSGLLFILRRTDREAREKILDKSQSLLENGFPSKALDAANRLIRRAQRDGVLMQDSRMWLSKARALTGHREYGRSITYYSMALEIDQNNEELWFEKGELHRKLKQWEDAEACYLNSTEIRYTYGEAWLKLAQMKERREKITEAEDAYVIALELESNHGFAYLGLGRVQAKLDRVKEALKSIEKSIALLNDDYRPYMVRGDIYYSIGDYERSDAKGYSKAVNIRPDLKNGWRKLAKVYRSQDKKELLIMALSRILEIDSEDQGALWERAECHFEEKKLGDSMGDIHRLLALNPGNQKARKFKAKILEKLDTREWN
ncbi:MAG: tetratricopeptide repeat protein [Candidatus Poseidoniia archaeon]|nr:tetratricopeptide repeat protein [Candidatus Poseidoniia archaeon]